jgi:hypothetical protein
MSEPGQAQTPATASEQATSAAPRSRASGGPGKRAAIIAVAGCLLVATAVGLVLQKADLGPVSDSSAQPTLSYVAQRDISAAATTLTQSAAGPMVQEAESCKIPLGSVTITRGTADIGSTIRIRSGSYVSPYFTVTEAMQRIAVPYPAPYGSGSGTITIEGNAHGAIVGLTPARVLMDLPTAQTIPVVWRPVNPC